MQNSVNARKRENGMRVIKEIIKETTQENPGDMDIVLRREVPQPRVLHIG